MVSNSGLNFIAKHCGSFFRRFSQVKPCEISELSDSASKTLQSSGRPTFNKSGARLVDLRRGVPVSESDKVAIPNAATVDIVTVQSGFGTKTTEVVSYKDKDGNLIKRYFTRKHKDTGIVEKVHTDYSINRECGTFVSESKHFIDDMLVKTESIWDCKAGFTSKETTSFFERAVKKTFSQLGKGGKFVELSATRQTDGLAGNKVCATLRSNCLSKDELNKLSKLSYLHEFQLIGNEFLQAITPEAVKSKKFKVFDKNVKVEADHLKPGTLGVCRGSVVKVDVDQHYSNSEIVDTVNHELRHVKQNEASFMLVIKRLLERFGLKKKWKNFAREIGFSNKKRQFAEKAERAKENYVSADVDYDAYYGNFREVDARRAGEYAKNEYNRQKKIFDGIFLYNKKFF